MQTPIERAFCSRCSAWRGSLGLEPTLELYVQHLVEVFREVKRVLREDGTLWLNLGDSYTSGGRFGHGNRVGYKQSTNRGMCGDQDPPRFDTSPGLKPKDLVGIPWRVAFALQRDGADSPETMDRVAQLIQAITQSYEGREEWPNHIRVEVERLEREWRDAQSGGWWLRSDIIWAKRNPMPESVRDRPTRSHEYIFLLAKAEWYYYNAEAIAETSVRVGGIPGGAHRTFVRLTNRDNRETLGLSPVKPTRNKRSVWRYEGDLWTGASQPYKDAHFATFPEALVEPCILAGSKPGDVILDPFAGSGTVVAVAERLGRLGIGIEL